MDYGARLLQRRDLRPRHGTAADHQDLPPRELQECREHRHCARSSNKRKKPGSFSLPGFVDSATLIWAVQVVMAKTRMRSCGVLQQQQRQTHPPAMDIRTFISRARDGVKLRAPTS